MLPAPAARLSPARKLATAPAPAPRTAASRRRVVGLVVVVFPWSATAVRHRQRFFPTYAAIALPQGAGVAAAVAELEPIRRLCLRRGPFLECAINERQHVVRNPECLTVVLEPVTEDGLRATAMTSRMGDEQRLREWVALVREAALGMHRGAYAIEPEHGGRQHVPEHVHTQGAHDLAAGGVRMLAATGSAVFAFDDLA